MPKFKDERDLQAYDAQQAKAGGPTFAVGVKFGVDNTVTAVKSTGKAMLVTNVQTGQNTAPTTMYGAVLPAAVMVNGKPVVSEMTFSSPGTMYGSVVGTILIIICIIILIAIIGIVINCLMSKAQEMKNPKKSSYTDSKGCVHDVYTGGGGFLGSAGITDLNNCTAEIQNQGGYTPFLSTGTGTGVSATVGNLAYALIGVGIVSVIGYVAYKKVIAPHLGKKPAPVEPAKEEPKKEEPVKEEPAKEDTK